MKRDEILFEQFASKTLLVRGVPFYLSDKRLSDEHNSSSDIKSVHEVGPNDRLLHDQFRKMHSTLVYAIPDVFVQEVGYYFSKAQIRHSLTGLICSLYDRASGGDTYLAAHVSAGWLEVAVCRSGQVVFANHYRWTKTEDIIYFLAAVIDDHRLKVNHFVLSGSHCDGGVTGRIKDELHINDEAIDIRKAPATRLMDLSALSTCV
jgi:hypothetical protein